MACENLISGCRWFVIVNTFFGDFSLQKKSAMTRYDYLNTVQSIHLNFHVWLQDPWLFWMCLLVGDSSGVGRTMCVTATLWFTCLFVFFTDCTSSTSPTFFHCRFCCREPRQVRKKYMTADLCCVPNKQDLPHIFPQLWTKTALECESVTRLMNPWRSRMSPHSLKEVSPWIISNQPKFRMAFC